MSMTSNALRPIVVDDTYSHVQYVGRGWFQDSGSQDKFGDFGPTYNHTLHGTNSNGSFSFAFQGISIHVFGSGNYRNISGVLDPSWECFVDKISIGTVEPIFPGHRNNELLCGKKGLDDGPHELTVNVTSNGQTFWFDYIRYTLSPGISLDTTVVLVDSQDPDIRFGPGWGRLTKAANVTNTTGSQMHFTFTGTSLVWLGLIPTEYPHGPSSGTFQIDGGTPKFFPLNGLDPDKDAITRSNEIFFIASQLAAGPHTLTVTYTGTDQQTPLTLDYMYITNTSTRSNPVPISGPTTIPIQSSSSTPQLPGKRGSQVGAIVGAVTGGLAFAAFLMFLLWRYKRGKKGEKGPPLGIAVRPMEAIPFVSMYAQQSSTAGGHKTNLGRQPWSNITGSGKYVSEHRGEAVPQTIVATEFNEAASGSVHQRVVHQDSGVRLCQEPNVIVEDIPPDYTPN